MSNFVALVEVLLPDSVVDDPQVRRQVHRDVCKFVECELSLAPAHLRLGLRVVAAAFYLGAFFAAGGRTFASLNGASRLRILRWWTRLGHVTRTFVRVHRTLSVLAFLEHPLVLDALDVENGAARQERFRRIRGRLQDNVRP